MAEATAVKPKMVTVEVALSQCDYCGFEHHSLNQLVGQSGNRKHICGDCFIKVFDIVLKKPEGKKAVEVKTEKPIAKPISK